MVARASREKRHGSLELNTESVEWSRLMGEKQPSWTQRAAISSSQRPNMCPPMSLDHQ